MSAASIDQVAEAMFQLVKETHGKKSLKATDLTKAMLDRFGVEQCSKELCKQAIRQLMDSGRCIYSYLGGSYITLPPDHA